MNHSSSTRYNQWSIMLHWIMFLLIAATFASIELRVLFDKGTPERDAMKMWHFMLGLSVFFLVWLRIVVRVVTTTPPIIPEPAKWQALLAKVGHLALYLFMIGMPLAGWLILSGEGKAIPFFGLELPALIAPNKSLAHDIEEVHEAVGEFGYWLIGLHALAAIVHHHVLKDNTMLRISLIKKQ
ncbi:cytochrome b [Pseudoalteromonas xiamenensis]